MLIPRDHAVTRGRSLAVGLLSTIMLAACGGGSNPQLPRDVGASSSASSHSSSSSSSSSTPALVVQEAPVGWVNHYINDKTGNQHPISGGEGATAESTYVVTNRKELRDALANVKSPTYASDPAAARLEPKIIYVKGTIYGNQLDDGSFADEDYYRVTPNNSRFFFDLYVKHYDQPYRDALQRKIDETGDQAAKDELDLISRSEGGRRSQFANQQKAVIEFSVPANTSILGVGDDAKLVDGYLSINTLNTLKEAVDPTNSNIIIRNMEFQAPVDLAPAWSPSDGEHGNWNARYKAISVVTGRNIWIDHCTFSDGENPDYLESRPLPVHLPEAERKLIQRHDGLLDIEDGSDFITVSYSIFKDHDKTLMIGSGDSRGARYDRDGNLEEGSDRDRNRITFYGNLWENSTQRSPRVRFGKVHLFNNYYVGDTDQEEYKTSYAIGMGVESSILSESNVFEYTGSKANVNLILDNYYGYQFKDNGSWLNGTAISSELEASAKSKTEAKRTAAENANNKLKETERFIIGDFTTNLGWEPPYEYTIGASADAVKHYVRENSGAGKLNIQPPQ